MTYVYSADPDQTAPKGAVSLSAIQSMSSVGITLWVDPLVKNSRLITTNIKEV